jgi:putative FmdB family regulatory protein
MPTYEFRCPQGHEFEKFYRSISGAEAQAVCPQCGQRAERMMSATGFAFKGSGFYLTDYGKNAHRGTEPVAASGAKPDGGETKGDAKGESKSESKSESKGESGSNGSAPTAGADPKSAAAPKAAEAKPAAAPPKKSSSE